MKKILLIIPYFGEWPPWFDAHMVSIKNNPSIDWLCPTDCAVPKNHPENIKFLKIDLKTLNKKVNRVVDCDVPLIPRKFCELKPAYAHIFSKEVEGYDFWGFCDMDIIWGDIRNFMNTDILSKYDIISSRKEAISGHFSLFKNSNKLNTLYRKIPNYQALFEHPKLQRTDEKVFTKSLKENSEFKLLSLKICWNSILCNQEHGIDSHQEYYLDKWRWQEGKLINNITQEEVMYLHFINWKRTMRYSEVCYKDDPQRFYISFNGMHYQLHTSAQKMWRNFANVFYGYYMKEKRRKQKLKFKSLLKRVKRKLNNT
ncbi:hypothetical protein LX95_02200 [Mesonia algae]|uniref:Uncharacterized protein n=1 Tax=Mesonia algae TaxID=213248 RepID=A0A2W7JUD3_9FLAO|nr:DUF6625 family protein [Mesonia algae]PZW39060.1 hypothetical protein LX95_02200 [Mesonia algae]